MLGSPSYGMWPDRRVQCMTFRVSLDLIKCHFSVASPEIKHALGDPCERVWFLQACDLWKGNGGGAEHRSWRQHMPKGLYISMLQPLMLKGDIFHPYCSEHKLIPVLLAFAFLCVVSYGRQKVIATTYSSFIPFE